MEEFTRECPLCGNEIKHTTKYSRNQCRRNKRPCRSCSSKIRNKKFDINLDKINEDVKTGKRKNGFQNRKHSPESRRLISEAKLRNPEPYKSQEFRDKMSVISSGENNPMYGRTVYDVWVEKYGKIEADKRDVARRKKWSIASSGKNNPMYGKETPHKAGNGVSGWYKEFYFRSLHELQFILTCERFGLKLVSVENIRIGYVSYTGNERTYSPDYLVNDELLIEVKPRKLHATPLNELKFEAARNYSKKNNFKFKVVDYGIPSQNKINSLIQNKVIILN